MLSARTSAASHVAPVRSGAWLRVSKVPAAPPQRDFRGLRRAGPSRPAAPTCAAARARDDADGADGVPAARAGSEGGGVLASPAGTATAGTASEGLLPGAWRQVGLALGLAVAVGAVIGAVYGPQALGEFVNVYLVEQSLSADNLFVMFLIFQRFKVPMRYRGRVLTWGIASAAVLRMAMIATGGVSVQSMRWVSLIFAAIILQSGVSMLLPERGEGGEGETAEANKISRFARRWMPVTSEYDGDRFFTRAEGPLKATPLFVVLLVIEFTDIVFSWDNVAAVFSCSTNMPLVWAATMLAVISLRAWYHVVATAVSDMPALQTATGGILMFLGAKLLLEYFMPALRISTYATLAVIAGSLGAAIAVSVLGNSRTGRVPKAADT
eukprot:jgi/Tetstr1/422652/TSEL_013457.t1